MSARFMSCVRPRIFLGAANDALDTEQIVENGITHVLSLLTEPLPRMDCHNTVKFIPIMDCETSDLLTVLEECLDFVDKAVNSGGKVLVHCIAGVSRSSSVVIAYLMRTENLNFYQAYKAVQVCRRIISPNSGFEQQLRMFEMTKCKVDTAHPMYKLMKLRHAAERTESGVVDMKSSAQWLASSNGSGDDVVFRCRKCRQHLFTAGHVVTHPVGVAPSLQDNYDYEVEEEAATAAAAEAAEAAEAGDPGRDDSAVCQLTLHTVALDWMEGALQSGGLEGKFSCLKCKSRLGAFKWHGTQCGCGHWVVPSFSFPRSRIDECPRPGDVLAGVHHSVPPQHRTGPPTAVPAGLTVVTQPTEAMTISVGDSSPNKSPGS